MERNIEYKIIGKETLPEPRVRDHWKAFIKEQGYLLKINQAIRVIIPKGHSTSGLTSAWSNFCNHDLKKKPKSREKRQTNGSAIVWLWFEEEKRRNDAQSISKQAI